jgi:RHS repeat-associated protein
MCLQRPIEPDHLGSPRKVIEPSRGTELWDWPILGDAFGTAAANDDPDGDGNATTLNLRFPGQQYDAATGLHYNYFRDYDPATGRYVESDPIGLRGGVSTFQYADAQPISRLDPFGLNPAAVGGAFIRACVAGCFSSMVTDRGSCLLTSVWKRKGEFLDKPGETAMNCATDCKPDPSDLCTTCFWGCVTGGVVGAGSQYWFGTAIEKLGMQGAIAGGLVGALFDEFHKPKVCDIFYALGPTGAPPK